MRSASILVVLQSFMVPHHNKSLQRPTPEGLCLQARQFWRRSALADAMYAYGRPWPVPWFFWLDVFAVHAVYFQTQAAFLYLNLLYLCSRLAAGSRAAWIPGSVILVAVLLLACWMVCARQTRRQANLRPHIASKGSNVTSLDHLCVDILELEEAKGLFQASLRARLGPASQLCALDDGGTPVIRRQQESTPRPSKMLVLPNLQLLLLMKASDEMIANLRGRLAAACHKVTDLWLTDINEAREAIVHTLSSP